MTVCVYLCFVDSFDVWCRQVCVDLVDVLLVHVLWHTVLIEVVHNVGARQHAVHLKPRVHVRTYTAKIFKQTYFTASLSPLAFLYMAPSSCLGTF